jgi:hypothetical protein
MKRKETKTMKRSFCILVMMFTVFTVESFSRQWNGIIPSVSTRQQVEKILHKGNFSKSTIAIYKYKKSSVYIDYERKDENDFDKDVVKKIMVYPDKTETLAEYIKKIPNFHKDFVKTEIDKQISHLDGRAVYRNSAEGFEIWVQKEYDTGEEEIISSFGYFAPVLLSASSFIIPMTAMRTGHMTLTVTFSPMTTEYTR